MSTTTTTIATWINSEWIRPVLNVAAKARAVTAQFAKLYDLRGRGTATASLPQEVSDVPDTAGIDALDQTEGTDVPETAFDTIDATVTSGEYGILRDVTDQARDRNVAGEQALFSFIVDSGARDLAVGLEADASALLGSFATFVGATGVDLDLTVMAAAMASLRNNEMPADDGAAYVLNSEQGTNYDAALVAAVATTLANYHTKPEDANGLNGFLGTWMNAPIWVTSLSPTANMGADVTGGLVIRGDGTRNEQSAALALSMNRDVRPELERSARGRSTDIVITMEMGVAEQIDLSGVSIITDAP